VSEVEEAPVTREQQSVMKMARQARRLPAIPYLAGVARRAKLDEALSQADLSRRVSIEDIARMKLLTMVIFAVALGLVGFLTGNVLFMVLFPLVGLGIGFFGPDQGIRRAASVRQANISRALPLAMEVIGMAVERSSVEAGLTYYCRFFGQENLAEELQLVMDRVERVKERLDIAMGGMLRKNRNEDLAFLVAAVGQATQMGARDLRQMLADQSNELRIKREQEVKARTLRAPVQMTFPTLFNVLSLLVILGTLAALQIFVKH
jgi:tight adherence protein C